MATGNWKQIGYSELSDSQDNITVEWTGHYENIKFSYRFLQAGSNGMNLQGKAGSNWKTSGGDYYYYYQAAADGSNAEYGVSSGREGFFGNYGDTSDLNQVNGDILNITGKRRILTAQATSFKESAGTEINDSRWYTWMNNTADDLLGLRIVKESGKNDFTAGSSLTVWAHDDGTTTDFSKDSITNVPVGTRYEETDTRKIFRRTGISNPLSQPSGLGDKVWDLTHASSYMTVDSDIVKTASDATISFWWRPASVSASQGVIKHKSGGSTSDYSFLIEFSPSNMLRLYAVNSSNQSSDIRTNTGILTADTWYHIVLTWDTSAGDGQWYLNGSSITTNSNSTSGVNAPRSTDYQFGSTSQGGESLGGYVSDFAIYDTILPATGSNSIASLYNSGNGAKANTVATSNLRCYWSGKDGDQSTIDNEATGAGADTDADFDTVSNVASAGKTPASWKEKGVAE